MAPPKLSYGLNLPSKKPPGKPLQKPGLTGQKRKKTIFDSDSDSDDDSKKNNAEPAPIEISTIGGLDPQSPDSKNGKPPPSQKPRLDTDSGSASPSKKNQPLKSSSASSQFGPSSHTNLSALHTSKKNAKTATDLDPTIYSYDSIYDSIHAKPSSGKNNGNDKDSNGDVPKYMTSLLRSADVRKRDQLRARDRLLAKEREAEGDEFADKEKFVTSAYKAQQEEVKRIEEEEAKREKEEEERRKGGGGMVGFYKDMLERGERRHDEVVKAAEEAVERKKREIEEGGVVPEEEETKGEEEKGEKTEAQIAAELKARGKNVVMNDEGQVVDKRQLLSAGLNVAPKPKKQPLPQRPTPSTSRPSDPSRTSETGTSRSAQRARQTEMVAAQLEERARQEREAEEAKKRELAEKTKSKKTETDVSSAKERYLARKREREMEAAKKKGGE